MSIYNLDAFFTPRSIAVIGASRRDHAIGQVVARNLFEGGFDGPILPVNPHEPSIEGVLAYADLDHLPMTPDLAVIATPASTIAGLLADLGQRGCRAAVVLAAGFEATDAVGQADRDAIAAAATKHGIWVIGPNCLGVLAPGRGINASFAHVKPSPGRIACVMQSGALAAAVLDWAAARGIGLSKVVSLGDTIDVDFGDMLDFLALDPETDAILLYVEGLTHARKFLSAARKLSRTKPIVALKAGRSPAAAQAAKSHTGALAGSDRVYDAAFQRSGILRVARLEDLFAAAEILGQHARTKGNRLAIVTNGGGAGVLATDALVEADTVLASLAPATIRSLDGVLPKSWSQGNPVDIIGDAPGRRYAAALRAVLADDEVDAVLVMNCPTAVASSLEAADAVVATLAENGLPDHGKPVLACWLGDHAAAQARGRLEGAGVPVFATPEEAVDGFSHLVRFRRGVAIVPQIGDHAARPVCDHAAADSLLRDAMDRGRDWLDEPDSKALLAAYGVQVARSMKAATAAEAADCARGFEGPVALKIRSPDITHKSDFGGVALGLGSPDQVAAAAAAMLDRIRSKMPDARIDGFTVEEMIDRPGSIELIGGLSSDPTFGPVVLFGQGGLAVKELDDSALALVPLNDALAADLVARTRISRLLQGYRSRPPADMESIRNVLIALSQLAEDHPEIAELDINPLLADERGAVALDARIRLQDPARAVPAAFKSYPHVLDRRVTLPGGDTIAIRPIRPDDAPALERFIESLDPETVRARFFEILKRVPAGMLDRLTQIDYDREMAFVATDARKGADEDGTIRGVGRMIVLPGGKQGEYALTVPAASLKSIGKALLDEVIAYGRRRGLHELVADELVDSTDLIDLARDAGARVAKGPDDPTIVRVTLPLDPAPP